MTQVVSTQITPPTWQTVSSTISAAPTWVLSELSTASSHPQVVSSWTQGELTTAPSSPSTATSSWTQGKQLTIPSPLPVVRTESSLDRVTPTSHPSNNSQWAAVIDNLEEDEALLVTVVPAAVGLVLTVTSVGLLCTVISVYWYSKSRCRLDIHTCYCVYVYTFILFTLHYSLHIFSFVQGSMQDRPLQTTIMLPWWEALLQ